MPISGLSDITNCVWWASADSGVYTDAGSTLATNGQAVQQWNDRSGAGNHFTQATSGLRPIKVDNVVGTLPGVRFTGSSSTIMTSGLFASDDFTILLTLQTASTATQAFLATWANTAYSWELRQLGGTSPFDPAWSFLTGTTSQLYVDVPGPTASAPHVLVARRRKTLRYVELSVDGAPWTRGLRADEQSLNSHSTTYLGGRGAFNIPFTGDILEGGAWSRALTDTEVNDALAYVAASGRWNITVDDLVPTVYVVEQAPAYVDMPMPETYPNLPSGGGVGVVRPSTGQQFPRGDGVPRQG